MISNQFPIRLTFKIGTLSNDFVAQNANGETIVYVRQKLLKLIEIFLCAYQSRVTIKAW